MLFGVCFGKAAIFCDVIRSVFTFRDVNTDCDDVITTTVTPNLDRNNVSCEHAWVYLKALLSSAYNNRLKVAKRFLV